jgi:hypothetical protein
MFSFRRLKFDLDILLKSLKNHMKKFLNEAIIKERLMVCAGWGGVPKIWFKNYQYPHLQKKIRNVG